MLKLEEYQEYLKNIAKDNKQSKDVLYARLHNAMLACDSESWLEIASLIMGKELIYHDLEFDLPVIHQTPIVRYPVTVHVKSIKKGKISRGEADA